MDNIDAKRQAHDNYLIAEMEKNEPPTVMFEDVDQFINRIDELHKDPEAMLLMLTYEEWEGMLTDMLVERNPMRLATDKEEFEQYYQDVVNYIEQRANDLAHYVEENLDDYPEFRIDYD